MFELAAISLTPTSAKPPALTASLTLASINNPAANPETSADAGTTPQPGMFEALLALQTAPAIAIPAAPAPALPVRQPSGKALPDAAIAVAADAAPDATSSEAIPAVTDDLPVLSPAAPPTFPPLPDFALIAAIFATPQRQDVVPETTSDQPKTQQIQTPASQPLTPAAPVAAAIALARTAQIELETTPAPLAPAAVAPPAKAAPQPLPQTATPRTRASAPAPPVDQPIKLASVDADEPQASEQSPEPASPIFQNAAPAAPRQDAAPASRAEPRAERIDFATLVETLSRAREDASPNAVRASVQHTDFGRISLRFEQDDKGAMSVAMSSADPGFARAVTASNEAASAQTQPDPQRGQNTAHSQGDSPRQQSGSRQGQPTRQPGDRQRRDDPKPESSGIFA